MKKKRLPATLLPRAATVVRPLCRRRSNTRQMRRQVPPAKYRAASIRALLFVNLRKMENSMRLVFALLLLCTSAFAGTTTIQVNDKTTGEPMPGVDVALRMDGNQQKAKTDDQG